MLRSGRLLPPVLTETMRPEDYFSLFRLEASTTPAQAVAAPVPPSVDVAAVQREQRALAAERRWRAMS